MLLKILSLLLPAASALVADPCGTHSCYPPQAPPRPSSGYTDEQWYQWIGVVNQDLVGHPNERLSLETNIIPNFKQANIQAPPELAIAPIVPEDLFNQCPTGYRAYERMQQNYPISGSSDLNSTDIDEIYGDFIRAAEAESGIHYETLRDWVLYESYGHFLTAGGLTQCDPVCWGLVYDANPELMAGKNRYDPATNIMARALHAAGRYRQH